MLILKRQSEDRFKFAIGPATNAANSANIDPHAFGAFGESCYQRGFSGPVAVGRRHNLNQQVVRSILNHLSFHDWEIRLEYWIKPANVAATWGNDGVVVPALHGLQYGQLPATRTNRRRIGQGHPVTDFVTDQGHLVID